MHRLLTLIAVLALALGACATDTGVEPDADPGVQTPGTAVDTEGAERITAAAQNTVAEGSARFTVTFESAGTPADDGTQPLRIEGESDFESDLRRMVFHGPQGELEMVVDGSVIYLQLPATEQEQWARLDLAAFAEDGGTFGDSSGLPFQDPADNLAILEDAATSVEESGEETIDGESTTRYDVTVDLTRAADEADPQVRDDLRAALQESGIDTLDMTVWIDGEDRIRRIAYTVDLDQAEVDEEGVEAEGQGEVTVTVEYFDFGATLDIEVPSDDQVVDIDEEAIRDSMGSPSGGSGDPSTTTSPDATATESPTPSPDGTAEDGTDEDGVDPEATP